jgi:hypothetical protein
MKIEGYRDDSHETERVSCRTCHTCYLRRNHRSSALDRDRSSACLPDTAGHRGQSLTRAGGTILRHVNLSAAGSDIHPARRHGIDVI